MTKDWWICSQCGDVHDRASKEPAMTPREKALDAAARKAARECAEHFWNDTGVMTASAQRFMRERFIAAFEAEMKGSAGG